LLIYLAGRTTIPLVKRKKVLEIHQFDQKTTNIFTYKSETRII
jgi:hypothetical protein